MHGRVVTSDKLTTGCVFVEEKRIHKTNRENILSFSNVVRTESIAAELDDLPLPYRYDVKAFHLIKLRPLCEHIERVGITVYPAEK